MRVWDVEPACLCRNHLLGEHAELHAVWSVITGVKAGYAQHPETLRWQGKLAALYARHDRLVAELARRGFRHASPLDDAYATGAATQDVLIDTIDEQMALLAAKPCACPLDAV